MTHIQTLRTVIALAAAGSLLAGCSDSVAEPGGTEDESVTTPTETFTYVPPDDPADLAAGRYRIPLSDTLTFDVDVEAGTTAHGGGSHLANREIILNAFVADEDYVVPAHPCRDQSDEEVGPTVDDLVTQIGNRPVYRVSEPEAVVLDGASGQFFELQIPAGLDASTCENGGVGMPKFEADGTSTVQPGFSSHWTILDVEGQRVVLLQFCEVCGADAPKRMAETVQSITFTPTS